LFRLVKFGFGHVGLGLTFCHLVRGSCLIMRSLFKFLLARGSYPYTWSFFFKVHLARGSGSNMGPPFKLHLARGIGSIVGSPFKVLTVGGSNSNFCSFSKCRSRVVVVV